MAILAAAAAAAAAAMNGREDDKDGHGQDVVMPGFRFHPTEEELVEFYLRRKVEGKRFNVELITFLDLYRYDPWELPALAATGEKEWFFYVPRDRKYRHGDRPNRVTTSGYWKATGADRMIRTEGSRSIGLKKTLVFYTGKAPKGVRTSWIMNEYRLPQSEKNRHQKVEISLCRVYKRVGVEDPRLLPTVLYSGPCSSRGVGSNKTRSACHQLKASFQSILTGDSSSFEMEKMNEPSEITNQDIVTVPVLQKHVAYNPTSLEAPSSSMTNKDNTTLHLKGMTSPIPSCTLFGSSSSSMPATTSVDELNKIVGYQQNYLIQPNQLFPLPLQSQPSLTIVPNSLAAFTNKLWEWNPIPTETERGYTNFKHI